MKIIKKMFNNNSVSYSQFLHHPRVHSLTESPEGVVDSEFFKRSVSLHYQHAYAAKKWQNWVYRLLFFGFSLLFVMLGALIYSKTTNFTCGFYVSNCGMIKNFVNMSCFFLAAGALTIGYKIHPEKDAIRYLVGKVEKELNHPTKQLQIEFSAIFRNFSDEWNLSQHGCLWIRKTL